jgi:hypothetical protein
MLSTLSEFAEASCLATNVPTPPMGRVFRHRPDVTYAPA